MNQQEREAYLVDSYERLATLNATKGFPLGATCIAAFFGGLRIAMAHPEWAGAFLRETKWQGSDGFADQIVALLPFSEGEIALDDVR
jgi:hypothetical protein